MAAISSSAQLPPPINHQQEKRLLLAHPTTSTIEVIATLSQKGLLNLASVELLGIYHKDEAYDYSQTQQMLDTLSQLPIQLYELTDTLLVDSLFCKNACSQTFKQLFEDSDGIIFFGGPDIPPAIYQEEIHPRTVITDPYRHYFETSFIYHLLGGYQNNDYLPLLEHNPNYLIFGICLGMQSMNVATGGTLIQDIPSEVYNSDECKGLAHLQTNAIHRNFFVHMPAHTKEQLAGSHFHQIAFKDYFFPNLVNLDGEISPWVNSYHHQAIKKLGKGFIIGASSMDGKIPEAIFHAHYPNVFGVQFHPERSQFFLNTLTYKFQPHSTAKYLWEHLDEESRLFHTRFWQAFNTILSTL